MASAPNLATNTTLSSLRDAAPVSAAVGFTARGIAVNLSDGALTAVDIDELRLR